MSDHLNDAFFRRLAAKLPGLKREYAQKAGERKATSNGRLKQPPCCICGKRFGSAVKQFSLKPQTPKRFCPACERQLAAGYCAAVTLNGARVKWIRFEGMGDLAGRVATVSDATMDDLEKREAKQ